MSHLELIARRISGNQDVKKGVKELKLFIILSIISYTLIVNSAIAEVPVVFTDAKLKATVEVALGIPDPTPSDMLGLTSLDASWQGITDLTGLEYATNLSTLNLCHNSLWRVEALSGLTQMQRLDLNNNRISSISALAGMDLLEYLDIHDNYVGDLSPLAGKLHLNTAYLYRQWHMLSNISILAGLTNLQILHLYENDISDLSPLASLTSLQDLNVLLNPLNDEACAIHIPQILANNPGVRIAYHPCGPLHLTLSSTAGGSVADPGEGVFRYDYGTGLFLTAKADPGFIFNHWSGSSSSTLNPIYITMDQDHEIRAHFKCLLTTLYVDDNAPGDPLENGSSNHPFDSIQEAIDVAPKGATVFVRTGTYAEDIDLLGKSIHLTGLDPNSPSALTAFPVITGTGSGPIIRFASGEDPNCRVSGLVFSHPKPLPAYALFCSKASPSIDHCLIVGNRTSASNRAAVTCLNSQALFDHCTFADNLTGPQSAALVLVDSNVTITHSILWGNTPQDLLLTGTSQPSITYSDLTGEWPGLGHIDDDPLFARSGYWADPEDPNVMMDSVDPRAVWMSGDYHPRSQAGRWEDKTKTWVQDDVTSPCIDAGDPARPVGYESVPNGGLVNLGVYGGTAQASRSYPSESGEKPIP